MEKHIIFNFSWVNLLWVEIPSEFLSGNFSEERGDKSLGINI
jgi:hypothetical protein